MYYADNPNTEPTGIGVLQKYMDRKIEVPSDTGASYDIEVVEVASVDRWYVGLKGSGTYPSAGVITKLKESAKMLAFGQRQQQLIRL
jgi:hypothetical protein